MKYSSFFIIVGLLSASVTQAAGLDPKILGQDMAAMTRSMDVLSAREEMKGTLSTAMIGAGLRTLSGDPTPEVTKKMQLISDSSSLSQCTTQFKENKSPAGDKVETFIEYGGADCPISLMAKADILTTGSGAQGDILIEVAILSPALKAQFEIEKMRIPLKVNVAAGGGPDGFQVVMKMDFTGELVTTKHGLISYIASMDSNMAFGGAGMKVKTQTQETYSGAGQTIHFLQTQEAVNSTVTETYLVDGKVVSKDEFTKQHQGVSFPGFSQDKIKLAQPHACEIRAYDSARMTLDQVRKAVKDGSVASLPATESAPMMMFNETGTINQMAPLFGQMAEVEISVTQDVARFRFKSQDQQELGAMTALLGDSVDITKVISNRIVRIFCSPK